MGTEQQSGVAARGFGLAALLAVAVIVAILLAATAMEQVRSLGASPGAPQGPATAAAHEPR